MRRISGVGNPTLVSEAMKTSAVAKSHHEVSSEIIHTSHSYSQ